MATSKVPSAFGVSVAVPDWPDSFSSARSTVMVLGASWTAVSAALDTAPAAFDTASPALSPSPPQPRGATRASTSQPRRKTMGRIILQPPQPGVRRRPSDQARSAASSRDQNCHPDQKRADRPPGLGAQSSRRWFVAHEPVGTRSLQSLRAPRRAPDETPLHVLIVRPRRVRP